MVASKRREGRRRGPQRQQNVGYVLGRVVPRTRRLQGVCWPEAMPKECRVRTLAAWTYQGYRPSMAEHFRVRCESRKGKNAAYAVIAVDVLADGTNRNTRQLWEQVKHLYAAVTGELPAINQQGQISLVQALARRGLLAMGRCVVTADKATTR